MVLRAPLVDLPKMTAVPAGLALVVSFLEVPPGDNVPTSKALYAQASPQTHVSAKTPPTLLMHGDADDLVPYSQSAGYEAALRAAGVATKLITVPGGKHGADFGFAQPQAGLAELLQRSGQVVRSVPERSQAAAARAARSPPHRPRRGA